MRRTNMKEIHAYRNEDGTYKLELIGDYYDNGELLEAHIVYKRVQIESRDFTLKSFGELFHVTIEDGDEYVKL